MNWAAVITYLTKSIGGGLMGVVSSLFSLVKQGFNTTMQFHQQSIATARQIGMTNAQAHAYSQVLAKDATELGIKYGITADAVKKITENLSNAIGRNMFLSQQQREAIVQMNKLVTEQTTSDFMTQMVSGMGAQVDAVEGAVAKTYATAMRQGLNVQKMSSKVAQNLQLANKLSFRDGVNGIVKMVALSEKVGANLQSLAGAANNFLELDKAIENAAKMQMLGGSAAMYGGNPLTAAYEANYDPEAFMERMTKTLGGYATFDKNTGMGRVNGLSMDFVRQIAQNLGMSTEEAVTIAKRQAEAKYKEANFGGAINTLANGNDNIKNFILNTSQVSGNSLVMKDNNGEMRSLEWFQESAEGQKQLKEMMDLQNMDEKQLMERQARELTSINEKIEGFETSLTGLLAQMFQPWIPGLQRFVDNGAQSMLAVGKEFVDGVKPYIPKIRDGIETVVKAVTGISKVIADGIVPAVKLVADNWELLLTTIIGVKAANAMNLLPSIGKVGGNAAGKVGSWIGRTRLGGYMVGNSWDRTKGTQWGRFTQARNAARTSGDGWLKSTLKGFGGASRGMNMLSKIGGVASIGIGVGAALGAFGNYSANKKAIEADSTLTAREKEEKLRDAEKERNGAIGEGVGSAIGGAIGTFLGGPLGTMIGSWLGGTVGKLVGENLDKIWNFIKGVGESIVNLIKKGWDVVWDIISTPFKLIGKGISGIGKLLGFSEGGIVPGAQSNTDNAIAKVASGEMVLTQDMQKNMLKMLSTPVVAKPVGEKEYIYTPTSSRSGMVNGNEVTVRDFNVSINGTIRLDGGSSSKNIDVNELLRDQSFVSSLKDIIKESINNDMNGGRFNQDVVTRRGGIANKTIW